MTFNKILASVSVAALLSGPALAQSIATTVDPKGVPAEDLVQGDENTVINNEDAIIESADGANMRTGIPAEEALTSPAGDSPYVIGTTTSFEKELAGSSMVSGSPWIGTSVTTADGIPVGSVTEVYSDGAIATAKVELDDSLGIDTDAFLIKMGVDATAADFELAQNEVEFVTEMRNLVGITPAAAE